MSSVLRWQKPLNVEYWSLKDHRDILFFIVLWDPIFRLRTFLFTITIRDKICQVERVVERFPLLFWSCDKWEVLLPPWLYDYIAVVHDYEGAIQTSQ